MEVVSKRTLPIQNFVLLSRRKNRLFQCTSDKSTLNFNLHNVHRQRKDELFSIKYSYMHEKGFFMVSIGILM